MDQESGVYAKWEPTHMCLPSWCAFVFLLYRSQWHVTSWGFRPPLVCWHKLLAIRPCLFVPTGVSPQLLVLSSERLCLLDKVLGDCLLHCWPRVPYCQQWELNPQHQNHLLTLMAALTGIVWWYPKWNSASHNCYQLYEYPLVLTCSDNWLPAVHTWYNVSTTIYTIKLFQ